MRALLLAMLLLGHATCHAQIPTVALEASCSEKVKTLDWKTGAKGEKLDGFCHGYLVAQFEALQATKSICVKPNEMATPEYLWSIAQTYKKETRVAVPIVAQEFVSRAFIRAYPCAK